MGQSWAGERTQAGGAEPPSGTPRRRRSGRYVRLPGPNGPNGHRRLYTLEYQKNPIWYFEPHLANYPTQYDG